MDTSKIRTALAVLGDHVDAKMADAAVRDLDAVDAALDKYALRKFEEDADRRAALRDTFAAAALTGCLAAPNGYSPVTDTPEKAARVAYRFADAMLAAREAK